MEMRAPAAWRGDPSQPVRCRLPPSAYFADEWLESERASVLAGRWHLVASTDEFVEDGDFVTATVGASPLVVVRGDDGALRAFHNVCRHRGMQLLTGRGNAGSAVRCFYHQWRYALDGALTVVPQRREQFPGLDRDEWGLLPASLTEWEGMVFVHPDPAATPLAASLLGVEGHLGSHRPGRLAQVATAQIEMRCNWKLFVENHVDIYHLWYLHDRSLGDFDHTAFVYDQVASNWASFEPLRDDPGAGGLGDAIGAISHLDERDRRGIGAFLVFPNLMIASSAGFFATYVAQPVTPDRTLVDLRVRAEPGTDPLAALGAVRSFIDEDIEACERVQLAVRSPAFGVGPLAQDHERPIWRFQGAVLDALERHRPALSGLRGCLAEIGDTAAVRTTPPSM